MAHVDGRIKRNAEADYLAGLSLRDICAKYSVAKSTVSRWASAGNWQARRAQVDAFVHKELPIAAAGARLSEAEAAVREHLSLARRLAVLCEATLTHLANQDYENAAKLAKSLRDVSPAVKISVDLQRTSLRIDKEDPSASKEDRGVIELPVLEAPPLPPADEEEA